SAAPAAGRTASAAAARAGGTAGGSASTGAAAGGPALGARGGPAMGLPILVLLLGLLGGCAASAGTPLITEEARCRHEGGMWRAATSVCDTSGSSGGGY